MVCVCVCGGTGNAFHCESEDLLADLHNLEGLMRVRTWFQGSGWNWVKVSLRKCVSQASLLNASADAADFVNYGDNNHLDLSDPEP